MKRMMFVVCMITMLITCTWGWASQQSKDTDRFNLNSRRISVQDGLLGNTVNELVQDFEGYIWMATNNGLTRYDGYQAVNYTSLSSDPAEQMEARIGRIVSDERNGLLWMSTATYMNACYDLAKDCFVDWTGCGDTRRQLNKYFLSPSGRGMFFYGNKQGVRRSQRVSELFHIVDYKAADGILPDDDVLMLLEDSAHNIFIPTAAGLTVLPPDEKPLTLLKGNTFVCAATDGEHTYLLNNKGEAFVVNRQLRVVMQSQIPSAMDNVAKANISFVWQGGWMIFTPQGTLRMDIRSGRFERPVKYQLENGLNQGELPGYRFVANESGRLCIYPSEGDMLSMDLIPNAHLTKNRGRKFHIAADHEGRLFIATYGNGLYVWNAKTGSLRHFTAQDPNPIIRTNYLIYCVCDHNGCVWLGSEATGAYCLSIMTGGTMNYMLPEPQRQGDRSNAVTSLSQLSDGHVIVGTYGGGIYNYNPADGTSAKVGEHRANVTSTFVDRQGHRWVTTSGEGLFIDGVQYKQGDSLHPLPSNDIRNICQGEDGRIWVGTWNGGLLLATYQGDSQQPTFRQFLASQMNESRIKALQTDPKRGLLFVGTNNGIYTLDTRQENLADASFRIYNTANGRFAYDEIFCLHLSADGTLWAGAAGGGALKCTFLDDGTLRTEQITTREGLTNNNVYSIMEDDYGYMWVGTEEGISRINKRNNIVSTFQPSPVLMGNVATENCALRLSDGRLLFGTNYGVVTIAPLPAAQQDMAEGNAAITDLQVNGKSLFFDAGKNVVQTDKSRKSLTLPHDQNTLSFFFSDFNYENTHASLYQFYLEGEENDWQPMTTANHADYSELQPGHYRFHLRALSPANEWLPETVINVHIRQPWYNTWWAWMLYLLAAVFLGWYVWSNWKEKFDLRQQMKLERQLTDFRVQFFTHITHEFRTPLAIIKGAVDKLQGDRATLQTAQRGTQRLLRLVNQFMEFRKVNTGSLRLHVAQGDLVAFVKHVYNDFWPMAQQKNIQTTFTPFSRECITLFDGEIVETIVYNLISNAVKYTPEGGTIAVRLKKKDEAGDGSVAARQLLIEVEDSGPGLGAEQQEALFKPFMHGLASQGGMGIGLFTAYEMALTHHGSLSYQPANGSATGACFIFTLPADGDAYAADEFSSTPAAAEKQPYDDPAAETIIRQMQPEALNSQTVAIIEDDPDMMQQIKTEMSVYFRVVGYSNGRQGFGAISQSTEPPQLVICDVMLPDMNGYDIVRQLKAQPQTTDIPIIMLTALDDEAHQIKAYEAGADDYMVKPCNWRLLVARTIQLIRWSHKQASSLSAKEQGEVQQEKTAPELTIITTQADKVFLDRLAMLVAQHMREDDFCVDQMAQLMSMGRTKFYGRVKELTGLSPNKYLMQQRMTKAADLLADGVMTVSEVSYQVGIQDTSYFNKCFKAQFGVTPSKYARKA